MRMNNLVSNSQNRIKIYEDSTRFLSKDDQNILEFPVTRMDLTFWSNIVELTQKGEEANCINMNTELIQLNKTFNDLSLFHHFAGKVEVIQVFHQKYKQKHDNGTLTEDERNVPLILLHKDQNGKTALDLALEQQQTYSFALMIDMIARFDHLCLSKMMLNSVFSQMLTLNLGQIQTFFDQCIFNPTTMKLPMVIEWPSGSQDQLIFASPTSLITEKSLELAIHGSNKPQSKGKGGSGNKYSHKELQDLTLKEQKNDDTQTKKRRVSIQCIDFDWIFEEDNTSGLIKMLATKADKKLYMERSLNVFIDFMWRNYKPVIVMFMFVPYLIYMFIFVYMSTQTADRYMKCLETKDCDESEMVSDKDWAIFFTVVCFIFCIYFALVEVRKLIQCGVLTYLSNPVNIDLTSVVINFYYLCFIQSSLEKDALPEDLTFIRNAGAMAVFFMWVKLFNWMRLFSCTAYFVNLICQSIIDIKVFSFMAMLVMFGFANFFIILDYNNTGDEDNSLIRKYADNKVFDSFLSIYLIMIGDFDNRVYGNGLNSKFTYFFFILATFFCIVVFMNMIIAIMGSTFEDVRNSQQENALHEQMKLIYDFNWLINLKSRFKGDKYIVFVQPDDLITQNSFMNFGKESFEQQVSRRLNEVEDNVTKMCTGLSSKVSKVHEIQMKMAQKDEDQKEREKLQFNYDVQSLAYKM